MKSTDTKAVCKFIQKYSKHYAGTMYSSPMPAELDIDLADGRLLTLTNTHEELLWAAVIRQSERPLRRKSFTGATYEIPAGKVVVQYSAHLPSFADKLVEEVSEMGAEVVYAYQDDRELCEELERAGYRLSAVRIGATSEVQGVWTWGFSLPPSHEPEDVVTLIELPPLDLPRDQILEEVSRITQYRDDYPYYNKNNSWAAASLRGYKPHDPLYGLKPSEMSRKWRAEHPEDAGLVHCQDTVLSKECPGLMSILSALPYGRGFERVRLLRLGTGELTRHCDITDRDLGTRDGQICRLHLPIVTHPDVRNTCWGLDGEVISRNLEPWHLYYMDIRKPHAAKNMTNRERIHFMMDVYADERLRQVLRLPATAF